MAKAKKKVPSKASKKQSPKSKAPAKKSALKKLGSKIVKAVKNKIKSPPAKSKNDSKIKKFSGAIVPVRSRVLIQRDEEATQTAGGLYIPDAAKDKPIEGRVVAIGSGRVTKKGDRRPLGVQVGDRVLFNRYSGSNVTVDGLELLVIEEAEILGIIQD